jgi:hypothetical protein
VSHVVAIELEMPDDLARFRLPSGVDARLSKLLDRQDRGESLSVEERQELSPRGLERHRTVAAGIRRRVNLSGGQLIMGIETKSLRRRCEYILFGVIHSHSGRYGRKARSNRRRCHDAWLSARAGDADPLAASIRTRLAGRIARL